MKIHNKKIQRNKFETILGLWCSLTLKCTFVCFYFSFVIFKPKSRPKLSHQTLVILDYLRLNQNYKQCCPWQVKNHHVQICSSFSPLTANYIISWCCLVTPRIRELTDHSTDNPAVYSLVALRICLRLFSCSTKNHCQVVSYLKLC